MTVYESLVQWLNGILTDPKNGFPVASTVIDLEMIPNWQEYQNAGLFSSPNDIHTPLIGGQVKYIEFKSFYLRLPFNEFQERLNNEVFLEKFRECINWGTLRGALPRDNREWFEISCTTGIYPAQRQENNQYADYLIPLRVVYIA
ncbi:MAG: hypothetical protein FWF29_02255 [Treponema sp.]|nr:hypothetical protein [Treponema sp.]